MGKVMIYGANGYTGKLLSERALSTGMDFVLGGRTRDSLQSTAAVLRTPYRVFGLDDPGLIDLSLQGITVLMNCAGPFSRTAEPLIEACIRTGTHYLDTSVELSTYVLAEQHDLSAKDANVMLLPGCGGSVATFGCLVGRSLEHIDNVQSVDLAPHVSGSMSRGSAITASEGISAAYLQRHGGKLVAQDAANTTTFDFADGRGPVTCVPVTLPDIVTIHKFFGVQNIRTFANASGDAFPTGDLSALPDGPTARERAANQYDAAIVVTTVDGKVSRAAVRLLNGYTLIAMASIEAARRVLVGDVQSGFQTSATLFGFDFIGAASLA
ncbi:hypothetical protein B0A48_08409 [Cryoendolithus antarcticus]|uniref:Saccharopine dehydrogenase NADP binding domain-containing protein n=1 Tax=Cryoendolithus antarcticus TaxID=1507870 RepID=A0A1V8T628_9PEZI|nr:hypothetical protein B0A48_08409 [Cryoendolithus antarcticus]